MSESSTTWVPWRFVFEITKSGGEVNWLIDGLCGKGYQPSTHVDLTGDEQRPEEQYRCYIGPTAAQSAS